MERLGPGGNENLGYFLFCQHEERDMSKVQSYLNPYMTVTTAQVQHMEAHKNQAIYWHQNGR